MAAIGRLGAAIFIPDDGAAGARESSPMMSRMTTCSTRTLAGSLAVLGIIWFAIATCSASAPQAAARSDQEVLIGLERGWNEAVYRNDVAFVESILADDFMATYENGEVGDRTKELQLVAGFNQQVDSAIQDDFAVRVYRDTAVVTFTLHLVGIKQGQRAELNLRYTDVWIMSNGRWRCVSTQSTRITPK
jgi:ketosteroid isomerase-like protein